MNQHIDDVELLDRWADGCRSAGTELFERYWEPLRRFFDGKAPEVADDLAQATLLACLESPERLRERHCFRSYLFGIARHLLYQHYRAGGLRRGKLRFNTTGIFDNGPSPSTLFARRNEDTALMRALQTLPMDMRILLELTYWEDIPASGVADVMGVAENTIYSRLHRAKQRLRVVLEELES